MTNSQYLGLKPFNELITESINKFVVEKFYSPSYILVNLSAWRLFTLNIFEAGYNINKFRIFNSDDYINGSLYGLKLLRVLDLEKDFEIV